MPKTYHIIQQWSRWLKHELGQQLLATEQKKLSRLLTNHPDKKILLIGVSEQNMLLENYSSKQCMVLGPLVNRDKNISYIESEFYDLPVASASIDLVMLPHTLEFIDNPRKLLEEACRLVKPEGDIMILCFNPFSLWGLKKWLVKQKSVPWSGSSISATKIKTWLTLADFELVEQKSFLFRPPLQSIQWFKRLKFLEWLGAHSHIFWGGVYISVAKAKVIPLTPIKLRWKQQLAPLSVTLPGPTLRDY